MSRDHRDLIIDVLIDSEADLIDANRQMVDLIADLAFENYLLRQVSATFIDRIRQLTSDLNRERRAA